MSMEVNVLMKQVIILKKIIPSKEILKKTFSVIKLYKKNEFLSDEHTYATRTKT